MEHITDFSFSSHSIKMYTIIHVLLFDQQVIFTNYKQPFAVTCLGASLMVVYLPIAFIKDWVFRSLKRCSSKSSKNLFARHKEIDLSAHEEDVPLVSRHKENMGMTTREIATCGFYMHLSEVGSVLLLETSLVFSQLYHMGCSLKMTLIFIINDYVPVLLKKFAGEEGKRADVQKLFEYIGHFTLVALWWLGKPSIVLLSPKRLSNIIVRTGILPMLHG
ncbi:hypothetical protein GIB67_008726, partial [Kingdonia uniflora]